MRLASWLGVLRVGLGWNIQVPLGTCVQTALPILYSFI